MDITFSPNDIDVKLVHALKAPSSIEVTLLGIVTSFKLLHLANKLLAIVVIPLPIVKEDIPLQR